MRCEPPVSLSGVHDLGQFACGEPSLDAWLLSTAQQAQKSGTAQTYISILTGSTRVVGYFAIAAGSIERDLAKGWLGKNSPDPVPAIVLGRLAVDEEFQGEHVGGMLLLDAFERALQAAEIVGAKAILVNPISEKAHSFYRHWGFEEVGQDPSTLFVRMSTLQSSLTDGSE
jgi:GNAT superfamily N-acetyltransferase